MAEVQPEQEMSKDEALNRLRAIRGKLARLLMSVDRRRSMRPSEKAMTKATLTREIEAIDYAIRKIVDFCIAGD